jgi:hypothetical protein
MGKLQPAFGHHLHEVAEAESIWAQKLLDKEPTMATYLRGRERPWFRSANEMLKRLPTGRFGIYR